MRDEQMSGPGIQESGIHAEILDETNVLYWAAAAPEGRWLTPSLSASNCFDRNAS